MDIIMTRQSIRKFTAKSVSDELVKKMLEAAMQAPSAKNKQPWEFIVFRNKENFEKIKSSLPYAKFLTEANVCIVVCGNLEKEEREFWVQDCSAATENILLKAHEIGLGAVWIGLYPLQERCEVLKNIFSIPNHIVPLSLIAIGYPNEVRSFDYRYNESLIHYEKW